VKKVEENCQLPWDVLDIISKALDFDDHFQFAGVCKNWRAFHENYGRNFLASQEPLLLQISDHVEELYSFVSIPDQKVYHLEMMKGFLCSYVTFSSGYFITTKCNNSFMLINPLTMPCLLLANALRNLSWWFYVNVVCMYFNLEIVVGLVI